MKEFIRKNLAIIIAFTLPIAMMIIVAVSVYLPSLFISTNYNFIYTVCTNRVDYYPYNCKEYLAKKYSVAESSLIIATATSSYNERVAQDISNQVPNIPTKDTSLNKQYTDRIFLHDTKKNESREITIEEAKTLTLNSLLTSPDGVTVSGNYSNGSDFSPFGGSRSSFGYYLTKGRSQSNLNLINNADQYYRQDNFQFIGWVLPGRN